MKILKNIFFFILIASTTACSKIDLPEPEHELLLGEWEWVESSGGINGEVITPSTKGFNKTIEYKEKGVFKVYKDNKKTTEHLFTIEKGPSIYSSEEEYQINYYKKLKKIGIIGHHFSFVGNDTLLLSDECMDCYSHVYARKR